MKNKKAPTGEETESEVRELINKHDQQIRVRFAGRVCVPV